MSVCLEYIVLLLALHLDCSGENRSADFSNCTKLLQMPLVGNQLGFKNIEKKLSKNVIAKAVAKW